MGQEIGGIDGRNRVKVLMRHAIRAVVKGNGLHYQVR